MFAWNLLSIGVAALYYLKERGNAVFGVVRLIILGLLIGLAMKLYRKFQQNRLTSLKKKSNKNNNPAAKKTVRCEQCGVYVPSDEAIHDAEKTFCSVEHQAEHRK